MGGPLDIHTGEWYAGVIHITCAPPRHHFLPLSDRISQKYQSILHICHIQKKDILIDRNKRNILKLSTKFYKLFQHYVRFLKSFFCQLLSVVCLHTVTNRQDADCYKLIGIVVTSLNLIVSLWYKWKIIKLSWPLFEWLLPFW